ncbi:MAG: MaoC family dehydratase [Arachnia sp.]
MTISVGQQLPPWGLASVSREKMKTMAPILGDPNPSHFDVDAVRALGMGDRPVNQGPNNLGYVMNMLAQWSGSHERLLGIRVRFLANVLGDDEVIARGEVTDVQTEGERVVAQCAVELVLGDGTPALSGTARVDVTDL